MKKKGLIISTIVMVIVLIASLTTATYAWFTASNATTIDGFNVEITSSNAVKIGVSTTYVENATQDSFFTGNVEYAAGAEAGKVAGGTWTGTTGLSATISHNIEWGTQAKAVGFSTESALGETAAAASLTEYNGTQSYAYAANKGEGTNLANNALAVANTNGDADAPASDYVHFNLGVVPTKNLATNSLYIILETGGTGTTLGIMSALRVAYRVDGGTWQDEEFFAQDYKTLKTAATLALDSDETTSYQNAYGSSEAVPSAGAGIVKINGLAGAEGTLSQVEVLIYISGNDPDCIDNAMSSISGQIKIFFHTVDQTA